jgi:uncharacterized repeat protein (TIGR01451 family)
MDVDTMKKTSIRLATIGVVIVLSAFAIALAQHDARNRERDQPLVNELTSTPAVPIAVEGGWNRPGLVRANNDGLPPAPLARDSAQDVGEYDGNAESGIGQLDFPNDVGNNPLRGDGAPSGMLLTQYDSQIESEVVQATGEIPADGQLGSPPPWLSENNAAGNALPALPTGGTGEVLDVPSFPQTSLPTSPASPPPATSQALPSFPIAPVGDSPSLPKLPQSNLPISDVGRLDGSRSADELSDTQRGKLPATNLGQATRGASLPEGNQPRENFTPSQSGAQGPAPGNKPTNAPGVPRNAFLSDAPLNTEYANEVDQPNSRVASVAGASASLVSNQPGNRYLDGSQSPILQIQKRAPEEIQVGKKATFVITVRNAGNAMAHDVTVVDSVPRGARFESASPAIAPSPQGILKWELGEMAAGDERTITLQITPEAQGEVGSVASVHFAAQASVRTIATLPKIEISMESQPEVLIGGSQSVIVTVKNSGTGVARNVRIQVDIPQQLRHETGESELDAPIGDLRPHEVVQRTLSAAAVQAGQSQCLFRVVNDDGVQAEGTVAVDVRAPQLAATIQGPTLRYLERQATYRITVQNTGTAAATQLNFVVRLPSGLKYVSANPGEFSEYDPNTHTVTLGLEELAAGKPAPFDITVLPVELGPQVITFAATGALGVAAEARGQVVVEGLAELAFTIGQDNGTIETGATSTYSVQVTNIGNKPDKEVQLLVQLPDGTELVDVNAPGVDYRLEGNKLLFAAIPEMKNRDQRVFQFEVRHNQAGNQVVRTQLTSQNWPVAVVKEEGTLVYNDQN